MFLFTERSQGQVAEEQPPLSETHRVSNKGFLSLQLKDENSKLRRKLTEVQSFSETQTEM